MTTKMMIIQVLGCYLCCAAGAAKGQGLPWHLMGSCLSDIESEFLETVYDGAFDDEYFNGKEDERLLVINEDRRYVTLHMVDRLVTEVYVSDSLYTTERGVRIGDELSKVRSAYPEAFDPASWRGRYWGTFQVIENSGRISFWFRNDEIERRRGEGETVRFDDAAVERSRLWMMHMTDK